MLSVSEGMFLIVEIAPCFTAMDTKGVTALETADLIWRRMISPTPIEEVSPATMEHQATQLK